MNKEKVLIYAVGGGHGHAVRGLVLGQQLQDKGASVTVLIRAGSLLDVQGIPKGVSYTEISEYESLDQFSGETLVVDTFPTGWNNELGHSWRSQFEKRVFIARYRNDLDWSYVQSQFHEIWLPYSEENNEWDEYPSDAKLIGLITKPLEIEITIRPGKIVVLLDTERRCSEGFQTLVSDMAVKSGYDFQYTCSKAPTIIAAKLLIIGAGYNTFYELFKHDADIRFVPIKKRFDDQFRRVARMGLGISTPTDLYRWFDSPFNFSKYSSVFQRTNFQHGEVL